MRNRSIVLTRAADVTPPQVWFGVSAVFHYLGPSFAVLLFPAVGSLGVAWFRIASAALFFAPWTPPWRVFLDADRRTRWLLVGLGFSLAVMNTSFYLALERLPMSLVAAIEFIGTIGVALYGMRTPRNVAALSLAVAGAITADLIKIYLYGVVPLAAGTWVGLKLYGHLDEAMFRKVILVLLLLSGVALILPLR